MATFTNQAQITYNNRTVNSNMAIGEIQNVLSIAKTSLNTNYQPNDVITYVLSIVNSGNTPFNGVTLTDNLGSYDANGQTIYPLTYNEGTLNYIVNGKAETAPTVTTSNPLTISALTIPASSNATLIYQATVNEFANPTTTGNITNTATLTGPSIATPTTTSITLPSNVSPNLSIVKNITPVPVQENGTITYTFTILNTGNAQTSTTDDVILTDTFNPILENITVTFNGTAWTEGTEYSYDEATGVFTTTSSSITVPSATFTQNIQTNEYVVTPGVSTLTISGTI